MEVEAGRSLCVSDVIDRIFYNAGPFRGEMHKAIVNGVNRELREIRPEAHSARTAWSARQRIVRRAE